MSNAIAPATRKATTIATTRTRPRTSRGTSASNTISNACQASDPLSIRIQLHAISGAASTTTRSALPMRRLRRLGGAQALGEVVALTQHRDGDAGGLQPQELRDRLRGGPGEARRVDQHQRDVSARQRPLGQLLDQPRRE